MKSDFKDIVRSLGEELIYYGIIMFLTYILVGLHLRLDGWILNTLVLFGYMWGDISTLKNGLGGIKVIYLAKVINLILLIIFFRFIYSPDSMDYRRIGLMFPLLVSSVIIFIYWLFNNHEDYRNSILVVTMFCFGIVTYGYIGLVSNRVLRCRK